MEEEYIQEPGIIRRGNIELTARDDEVLGIYSDRSGISPMEPGFPYNEKRVLGLKSKIDDLFS